MSEQTDLLDVAENVVGVLSKYHIDAVVIGAIALAAHHYIRLTEDLDLAVNADIDMLHQVTESLRERGYSVEFREPDSTDPLGGVIDITGSFGLLQVINFADRFPAVIDEAVRESALVVREGSLLKLAPIPHLIALKLYAGGTKSKADIIELLLRNPELDIEKVRILCNRFRLRGLDDLITEAREIAGR